MFSLISLYYIIHYRINILLIIGMTWLGIITPFLQMVFAYLYYRYGHIWSRVLNAELDRAKEENKGASPFYALKYLLTRRVLH